MAFWGIEVKPGKPFTHSFDRVRGRLRISQATLGIGSSEKKSLVQCNVGDKSPVFLCALLPDKTESCHLDLEFEEADDVVFSVIGPRSVYLTGYYVCNGRHSNLNDDTDSYGEDIANTETDESTHHNDEDEYDDSFIDDGNLEVFPPSPVSSGRVSDNEKLDNKKPKEKKGSRKRLKKRYIAIESDNEHNTPPENIANGSKGASGLESEDEDNFLISSFYNRATEAKDKVDGEMGKTGNKMKEDDDEHIVKPKSKASDVAINDEPGRGLDLPFNSLLPSAGMDPENDLEVNKERNEMSSEGKILKADNANCYDILKEDQLLPTEEKTDDIGQDLLVKNGQFQNPVTDNGFGAPYHSLLPSDELGLEEHIKSKKKRKARRKEGKAVEMDSVNNSSFLKDSKAVQDKAEDQKSANHKGTGQSYDSLLSSTTKAGSENGPRPKKRRKELAAGGKSAEDSANNSNIFKEDKVKQNEEVADKSSKDLSVRNEQDHKFLYDKNFDDNSNRVVDGDQSVDKKRKKKKKSKIQENGGNKDIDLPSLSTRPIMGFEDMNVETESSQARTLSNGLIIQELEMGKTDGKIAALGKKVKVHYIGKLRDNEQIFDSNVGKAPLKFRLGAQDVIEGWNIGLDGMRVGGKRRLIVPPSIGYGSRGTGENIPPNSWLIYEIELVGVR